ncbi:MAG: hypothetical protein ACYCQJ_13335 [Nitrososphaerales archaeon]
MGASQSTSEAALDATNKRLLEIISDQQAVTKVPEPQPTVEWVVDPVNEQFYNMFEELQPWVSGETEGNFDELLQQLVEKLRNRCPELRAQALELRRQFATGEWKYVPKK